VVQKDQTLPVQGRLSGPLLIKEHLLVN
jgi:hypothetical protein